MTAILTQTGHAWEDINGNGIQDPDEPKMANVTIWLLDEDGNNLLDSEGEPIKFTTDSSGAYVFTNLAEGNYRLQFDFPGFESKYAPDDLDRYLFSEKDVVISGESAFQSDKKDSDVDSNGLTDVFTMVSSVPINRLDAGMYLNPALVDIGDYVWHDTNANGIQDDGEKGAKGVKVQLLTSDSQVIETTYTNDDGKYSFSEKWAGDYYVQFFIDDGVNIPTFQYAGNDTHRDSNANANGKSDLITLEASESNTSIDAGMVAGSSIGDRIWYDINGNGLQDNSEPDAANVTVTLLQDGKPVGDPVKTGADGAYKFDKLLPGDYTIKVTPPSGYIPTQTNIGNDDTIDSDAEKDGTVDVSVGIGVDIDDVDIGLFEEDKLVSIGDKVWLDLDRDGIQDNGEPGVPNVTVRLLTKSEQEVSVTRTDSNGIYGFNEQWPGDYIVKFETSRFTEKQAGNDPTVDSDANPDGKTDVITLNPGDQRSDIDAGVTGGTIGDYVWYDLNGDGIQESGEPAASGITVKLFHNGSQIGDAQTTDNDGKYKFYNLAAGDYQVEFTAPSGYRLTLPNRGGDDLKDSDPAQESGRTATFTLAQYEQKDDIDAGLFDNADLVEIGDKVWLDSNKNGLQDNGEPGVANITVKLLTTSGQVVSATTTNRNGIYKFDEIWPGDYQVKFEAPGYRFTTKDSGSNDAIDSDPHTSTGKTDTFTLGLGEVDLTRDAGVIGDLSLGDRVWHDKNGNGRQDSGEPGLSGVTVKLWHGGSVIKTTTTDGNGKYQFDELTPGRYQVQFARKGGFKFSPANAVNDTVDSDANPSNGVTPAIRLTDSNNMTIDAGMYQLGAIGNRMWYDSNGNGVQNGGESGLSGRTVKLYKSGSHIETTRTNSSGYYQFDQLEPGTYKVHFENKPGYKFSPANQTSDNLDSDVNGNGWTGNYQLVSGQVNNTVDAGALGNLSIGDKVWHDVNGNGRQDSGEGGIGGVRVKLWHGGSVIKTTTTDGNGKYLFDELTPGNYQVQFMRKSGYKFSRANSVNDTVDSDADQSNGITPVIRLTDSNDMTVDAGMYKPAALGNRVWYDSNRNGVQNGGEPGMGNQTVWLYKGNTHIATTRTNGNGIYQFDDLDPGVYRVRFQGKSGHYFSSANRTADHADSDANAQGWTGNYRLNSGQVNNTIDAGLSTPPPPPPRGSIGDWVWADHNHNGIQDESVRIGWGGWSIYLEGKVHSSQTVNGAGNYHFNSLPAGNYRVRLVTSRRIMPKDRAADHIDSDGYGNGYTDWFYLGAGSNQNKWDFGLSPIAIDLNHDGLQTIASTDALGTFDLTGSGKPVKSGWLSPQDGFLAVDHDGDGTINNISELFGGQQQGVGFNKLARFDSNQDGKVDENDQDFDKLLIWQDKNSNHQTDEGELLTLKEAGVDSLKTDYELEGEIDENGNLHLEKSSVKLADGTEVDMTDIYFNVDGQDAEAAGIDPLDVQLPNMEELLAAEDQTVETLSAAPEAASENSSTSQPDTIGQPVINVQMNNNINLADVLEPAVIDTI